MSDKKKIGDRWIESVSKGKKKAQIVIHEQISKDRVSHQTVHVQEKGGKWFDKCGTEYKI